MSPAEAAEMTRAGVTSLSVVITADASEPMALRPVIQDLQSKGNAVGVELQGYSGAISFEQLLGAETFVFDARGRLDPSHALARESYTLKTLITALRAATGRHGTVAVEILASELNAFSSLSLGGYFDALVLEDDAPVQVSEVRRRFPNAALWLKPRGRELRTLVDLFDGSPGLSDRVLVRAPSLPMLLRLAQLQPVLPLGTTRLSEVTIGCEQKCSSRTFLNPHSLDAVALVIPTAPLRRLEVAPGATRAAVFTMEDGLLQVVVGTGEHGSVVSIPETSQPFILVVAGWRGIDSEQVFATGVSVTGARPLTVGEIVARHQAARARQERIVVSSISRGRTLLTFEAPGFPAPVSVTADTVVFTKGPLVEIEQRDVKVNGLALVSRSDQAPKLPIIEPQRVSTPPLTITLNEAYSYRLVGNESVGDRPCYLIAFDPGRSRESLFQGRAWIAQDTFGLARVEAIQTNLRGVIVSSEQRDDFVPSTYENTEVWLPSRSEVHQIYEGVGRRTPIHRLIETTDREVNPPDFDARLSAAHASSAVMLRDTPAGFQYLTKSGTAAVPRREPRPAEGQRVRTVAFGVLVDPNITIPLPFAGFNYLDFDFMKTGSQLNAFVGGTYGRLSWTLPRVRRTRWRLTADAFGIAAAYNDRSFVDGVERYDENIRQRPAHFAVAVVHPLSARTRIRAAYELDYTHFSPTASTTDLFVVPVSTAVHGARLALEGERGAWSGAAWWSRAHRPGWKPWGIYASERAIPTFQKFGVNAARTFVFSPRAVGRVEGSWMGGSMLDRFSRYTFGAFENQLHGYPSAGLRYGAGVVGRAVVSWTAASRLRLDGFADLAVVRDPGFGRRARGYPGLGAAAEAPAPFGLLISAEWGYGFQGRNTDGSRGTQVFRVTGYKMF